MAECIQKKNIRAGGVGKTLTQLVGCRFCWFTAGYWMLFEQLDHFQDQQPVMISDRKDFTWATRAYPRRGVLLPSVLNVLKASGLQRCVEQVGLVE